MTRIALLLLVVACAGEATSSGALKVVRDSTPDSVIVSVTGDVPADEVRQLVEEMAIAPGADDTSLFTTVREFDVDQWGRMWVFDEDTRSILVFAPDGALIRRVGREGSGPGELRRNSGMVILPDGGLAIWDGGNGRVSIFDSTGAYLESRAVPTNFGTSNGLLTDAQGTIFMRRPVTAPANGEALGRMGLVPLLPGGVFGDSIVIPELPVTRQTYTATSGGARATWVANYGPAAHWTLTSGGEIAQVNGATYEILLAGRTGIPVRVKRAPTPVPVDAEERANEEATTTWGLRHTQADWSWSGPPLPDTKAPAMGVFAGMDDRLWVHVPEPSERIPQEELTPPSDSTRPLTLFRMPTAYEVFGADGSLLGRVRMPPRTRMMAASGDEVWAIRTDADGLPAVVRYRVTPGFGAGE